MQNDAFSKMELPDSMRDLMKMGIEQARFAFETFAANSEKAFKAFESSSTNARDSLRVLNDKIAEISRANAEANFALAMRLAEAKDVQQAMAMQSEHVKKQMESFARQIEEIRDLATKAVQETNPAAAQAAKAGFGPDAYGSPAGGPGTFTPPGGESGNSY